MMKQRRKRLTQADIDKIRIDYERWAAGDFSHGNDTVYGIAEKHGVSTPTVHDLRNKGWQVGGKNRPNTRRIVDLEERINDVAADLQDLVARVGQLSIRVADMMEKIHELTNGGKRR